MHLIEEDRILMKKISILKGYSSKKIIKKGLEEDNSERLFKATKRQWIGKV